jgi:hypothetical protein
MQLTRLASPKRVTTRRAGNFVTMLTSLRKYPFRLSRVLSQSASGRAAAIADRDPISLRAGSLPEPSGSRRVDGIQHRQCAASSKEESEEKAENTPRENAHRSFAYPEPTPAGARRASTAITMPLPPKYLACEPNSSLRVPQWNRRAITLTIHVSRAREPKAKSLH